MGTWERITTLSVGVMTLADALAAALKPDFGPDLSVVWALDETEKFAGIEAWFSPASALSGLREDKRKFPSVGHLVRLPQRDAAGVGTAIERMTAWAVSKGAQLHGKP